MFLGIDVGSISMKFSLFLPEGSAELSADLRGTFLDPEALELPGAGKGYNLSYDRLLGDPVRKVPERLRRWLAVLGEGNVRSIAVTGRSGRQLALLIGATYENDFRCLVKAVTVTHPDVRTIFEMGGENAKVIRLEASGGAGLLTVKDYDTNGDCAAGTGSFIDQQAHRMKLRVEQVGEMVAHAASAARIAGRCSVFAKSDMIHAQQKGYSPEEILKGLCDAVARNFKSSINKGKDPVPKIALVGGLFGNSGVVRAIRDAFGFSAEDIVVPRGFAHMGALGAAAASSERAGGETPSIAGGPGVDEPEEPAFPS
ncbi:MAG: hypothetical protein M0T69_02860, partial [Deltaproteobacteria bacterium]|nr:hypothetical protein [Deltaproteobacteria bacterium]